MAQNDFTHNDPSALRHTMLHKLEIEFDVDSDTWKLWMKKYPPAGAKGNRTMVLLCESQFMWVVKDLHTMLVDQSVTVAFPDM